MASTWMVYLVRCGDGSLYTGITTDLDRRLAAHNAGTASRYTRSRLPVKLVHQEPAGTRSAALKREAAIKRLPRLRKLELVGLERRSGRRSGSSR
jgi:putative endonuclease